MILKHYNCFSAGATTTLSPGSRLGFDFSFHRRPKFQANNPLIFFLLCGGGCCLVFDVCFVVDLLRRVVPVWLGGCFQLLPAW